MTENNMKTIDPGEAVIGAEFVRTVQQTTRLLVQSAAELNNSIRLIERTFSHADETLLVGVLGDIRNVAGNLSEQWQELDNTLAAYDLLEVTA